jgi:N-acetylglucosamine kinase-like BadF-type ATPase
MGRKRIKYCSEELLCGIDGGGTITKVVVSNLEGQILHSFQTGTINHYGAGIQKVSENFAAIAASLLAKFNCLPGAIFTGNSALDGPAEDSTVQKLTKGVFEPSKVIFHSDVYIALLSFTMGNQGAVLISGTGSMACGIDAGGAYHTAGGWGQLLGDEGSAYHMALKGIKATLRAYDGLSEPTQLSASVMKFFDLKKMSDIIDKIYNPPVEKSVIAAFATEVENAANKGDKVALNIIESEAEWLYKLALAITGKCNTQSLGYSGSVLRQNDRIRKRLSKKLADQNINLQAPKFNPEIGALIGAFRESGNRVTDSVINNFLKYRKEEAK